MEIAKKFATRAITTASFSGHSKPPKPTGQININRLCRQSGSEALQHTHTHTQRLNMSTSSRKTTEVIPPCHEVCSVKLGQPANFRNSTQPISKSYPNLSFSAFPLWGTRKKVGELDPLHFTSHSACDIRVFTNKPTRDRVDQSATSPRKRNEEPANFSLLVTLPSDPLWAPADISSIQLCSRVPAVTD